MPSNTVIITIILVFWTWGLFSTTNTLTTKYFNSKVWFEDGNIFHIKQEEFWTIFQQHRNVNRHIDWLSNEISSLNRQIKSVKDQLAFHIHAHEQHLNSSQDDNDTEKSIPLSTNKSLSSVIKLKNQQNIYILKLLSNERLFDGYLEELIEIYEIILTTTIECIAIVSEQNSAEKSLFIKLFNGTIDKYEMNRTNSLKETLWKTNQPILIWNNEGKHPEYYRRFNLDHQTNQLIATDYLSQIKNRPRSNDVNFFDMMGQILRIKYHIDPSSLSCILEVFFGDIYTCDGRLIHPHELKYLSNNNNLFVFYGVMMDTTTEKQIYPFDMNHHFRPGDQIFFLFNNHPQFNSLSSLTCKDCHRADQTYLTNNNEGEIKQNTDNQINESPSFTDNLLPNFIITIPQNYIVYVVVTSIVIYVLVGIYITRKTDSIEFSTRKHSVSSRRGR